MTTAHPPQAMITDYAAGRLSRGMTLAVAGHLRLCPGCRDRAARLAALCGAVLATCAEPEPPSADCLDRVLARLGEGAVGAAVPELGPVLPAPLCDCMEAPRRLTWSPAGPGIARCRLDGFPREEVGLVRVEPGTRMPEHGHAGLEATLVLAGGLHDGARLYRRGDIAFCDETVVHSLEVAEGEPCLYLLVSSVPEVPVHTA